MDSRSLLAILVVAIAAQTSQGADWSYTGTKGPDYWKDLAPGYSACGGRRQSPIDLKETDMQEDTTLTDFVTTNFDKTTGQTWNLINNGHTTQVNFDYASDANRVMVSGGGLTGTFIVAQFHFHWGSNDMKGSEHTMEGTMYPMEVHIVTYNSKYGNLGDAASETDGLAVLGFFFEIAPNDNPRIQTLVDEFSNITAAPNNETKSTTPINTPFALDDFVNNMEDFMRYDGSLTTPGCGEVVTWTVFKDKILISSAQMAEFRKLQDTYNASIVDNYRPVMPLNNRVIRTSFPVVGGATTLAVSFTAILFSLLVSVFNHL